MKFLKIFLLFVVPLVVWGNTGNCVGRTNTAVCPTIEDRISCLTSLESRSGWELNGIAIRLSGSICVWCDNGACTTNNDNRCEPQIWLDTMTNTGYESCLPIELPKTYLYIANGKCGNNAQTGDTFDVASAKECRDSCDLNFHETYFSILTTEESPLSCTCYNDCDANSRRADANSEIYEVLSIHVSEILHDTELVNEKLENDLAICKSSAQDVNNNLAVCQTEFTTCEVSKQDANNNLAVCQAGLTTCEANKIALTDEKTLWKSRFEAVETLETEFTSNTFTSKAKVQHPGAEASIADTMSGVMQPHHISSVEKVGYVLFGVLLSSVFMWGTKKSKRDENLALLDYE